jgi:2-keto-4-pentenoate hydratase/2-oxohepta-3-ene-1,7-dioic acid hydratase in catechol pathway
MTPQTLEPVPRPSKILCAGLNYRPHVDETDMAVPQAPLLFAKWPSAIVGDGEPIVVPPFVQQLDYEAELAVVIGRRGKSVAVEHALDLVAGYTCLNDISARDIQFADGQWTRGKSFDSFCPIGPRVVPASEISDPQNLRIRCYVNGVLVQDDTTANMIFSVAELISYASQWTQLEAGDVLATGTPAGVALGSKQPRWLRHGDVVSVEIAGIGVLTNPVVAHSRARDDGQADGAETATIGAQ